MRQDRPKPIDRFDLKKEKSKKKGGAVCCTQSDSTRRTQIKKSKTSAMPSPITTHFSANSLL
jgi:hypothetical protein